MKKLAITILALGLGALMSTNAMATVPDMIPMQGVLADSSDEPVDALTDITVALYADSTTATALWTDTFTDVDVTDGFFSVYLGSNTALDFASLLTNAEIWVGITVETDPEMDRFQLATVPFAIEAQVCNQVGSLTESDINSNFVSSSSAAGGITSTEVTNWDTAYGWGNHSGLYAPVSHTHSWNDITSDMPAGFADGIDNDSGGDITGVTAGGGLSGGGSSGDVSLGVSMHHHTGFNYAILTVGDNYLLEYDSYTPASDGVCVVSVDAYFPNGDTATNQGPYLRVGYSAGTTNYRDEDFGFYVEQGNSNMSRTAHIQVDASTEYHFGCFLGAPTSGTWLTGNTYCHVSYFCY